MPTYEYRCPAGHDFERFYRKISDAAPQVACPECGKIAERIMSAGGGLLFKGSGFYLTDYGKNAHRASGSAPAKSESGGDSGGSGSSDSGSAAKDSGAAAKDSGAAAKSGESKSAAESKPAAEKKSSESTPAKSSGPKPSKDT
jgi:putative FmdB family regulatory protein